MSIPERIYRISKAYIGQVRDRIEALDNELARREGDAVRELEERPGGADIEDRSPDALLRRAQAKIDRANADLSREQQRARDDAGKSSSAETTGASSASGSPARVPGSRYTGDPEAVARAAKTAHPENDPNSTDYKVLGVSVGGSWSEVQAAYEKLTRRCDPRRFPEGSQEQQDATRILERVNQAYEALRQRLDPTVNRFNRLEF